MGSDDRQTVEATHPVLGSVKISSVSLNTLITIAVLVVASVGVVGGYQLLSVHASDTKDVSKELAATMKDMVQVGRESNCLNAFPPEKREANADLCKRLSR